MGKSLWKGFQTSLKAVIKDCIFFSYFFFPGLYFSALELIVWVSRINYAKKNFCGQLSLSPPPPDFDN